ncbi:MAG: hypothetical protein WBA51_19005 [Erythrobacter sp.]
MVGTPVLPATLPATVPAPWPATLPELASVANPRNPAWPEQMNFWGD